LLALASFALASAMLKDGSTGATAAPVGEFGELSPAMAAKLTAMAQLAPPGSFKEGDRAIDDDWIKHATPGTNIPSEAIVGSRQDWSTLSRRGSEGNARWMPLGPDHAKSLTNPFRDRAVYNAGTQDFSGRIAHGAIDPSCGRGGGDDDDDDDGGGGGCRLWIANAAGGGVWRTNNALSRNPQWKYLSMSFEHNSTAAIELDPNDKRTNTLWVGTGEPNACGSGCEAGVGLYKSTNGGNSWSGPFGRESFYNRAVGSIEVKPGNSNTIFAASGRAIRGLSSACCGGADALIPGAPHFGLFRSTDGGQNWQLVHQGATALCTASHPDVVSLNMTACSPRGARRVVIDPVDPNTIYASFYARGIWRSKSNGDPGTWEQIMAPVGPVGSNERAEFDVVTLGGETRMYVGVGGGLQTVPGPPPANVPAFARFRRNDAVRNAPAATVQGSWIDLTSATEDTPGYSSYNYCEPQCWYDNYVYAPARHFPNSGADANTVYLLGDNTYIENNWGPNSPRFQNDPDCDFETATNTPPCGRSNGRGFLLSTNAGVHFTDMTEDDTDDIYPGALHPDHHAIVVNPRNYKQFFDLGDGGVNRSNGRFVDDSGDCADPKGYTGTRLTFCQLVLSRVPERLTAINEGLRTIHFYKIDVSPHDRSTIIGGTQDNGSWERGDTRGSGTNGPEAPLGSFGTPDDCRTGGGDDDDDDGGGDGDGNGGRVWVNTNVADGGHNLFDIGDPCFRMSGWQVGQTMVAYEPKNQVDMNWTSDTHWLPCPIGYACEANAFIGVSSPDPVHEHWFWSSREHVFRSTNQGRNPILTKETHREHCNVWYGDADVDDNGVFEPAKDICDDWRPLGDPGVAGRLTNASYGADRVGGYTAVVERAHDSGTLWAATQTGRVFVSKNADNPVPTAVVFDRIDDDPTATNDPPRYPTAIHVDPEDPNHAWITYSGFNTKTPDTPGHVFEIRYVPGASTFVRLDGDQPRDRMGDIPATSLAVTNKGTIYVGTDYGCIASEGDGEWRECGEGLPNMPVADLVYVAEHKRLYAGTHGQGAWSLRVDSIEDRDDDDDDDDEDD
jgi:hypothetical protein